MQPEFGTKIKDKLRDAWVRDLTALLHPSEHLVLVTRNNLLRPTCDGLAVTNARVLAFFGANLAIKGPQLEVVADDIQAVRIRQKLGNSYLAITRNTGEEVVPASLHKADLDAVLEVCQRLADAETPVAVRGEIDAQATAKQTADDQWSRVDVIGSSLSRTAWTVLREHSARSETPWFVIGAGSGGVFAAFEDRCMIVKVGALTSMMAGSAGGGRITVFPYHDITGIEFNGGMVTGVLEILTPSYQGTANKDFWRGTGKNKNSDSNDPYTLSNTLPMARVFYTSALPRLNELRDKMTQAKRTAVVMTQPATGGLADELKELAALHQQGALTDDEFSAAKLAAISRNS